MCIPKLGDKRNWSIATGTSGFWKKASLHMYRARIDVVSANRNGKVGGKSEWKMAMAGGE